MGEGVSSSAEDVVLLTSRQRLPQDEEVGKFLSLIASFFIHSNRREKVVTISIIRSAQSFILYNFYTRRNQSIDEGMNVTRNK